MQFTIDFLDSNGLNDDLHSHIAFEFASPHPTEGVARSSTSTYVAAYLPWTSSSHPTCLKF